MKRIVPNSASEKRIFILSGIAALLLLVIDQATKLWVVRSFELNERVDLIPGLFSFTYVRNYGAAWSILSGHVWLLIAISLVTAAAMVYFFRKLAEGCVERYYALMLVYSGLVGNLIDRALSGSVVDFLDVHWKNVWQYPVFNVADMAICCGVFIYLISSFCRKSLKETGKNDNCVSK